MRDLLPHEYTHSWNGKFRRPADLWTPNYNVPMRDSLLWVYEGQTEYWGQVLAARSGLRSAAAGAGRAGVHGGLLSTGGGAAVARAQDTTNDEIIKPRRPQSWRDWQRFEDYYDEGELIWLEADTLIREQSGGKRSLDDFARAFFGINDGSFVPVTYTFDDVVKGAERGAALRLGDVPAPASRCDRTSLRAARGSDARRLPAGLSAMFQVHSDAAPATPAQTCRSAFSIGVEIDDEDLAVREC